VMRARIVLTLAADPCVTAASRGLGVDPKTARKWRDRYLAGGRKGLETRHRPGRRPRIGPVSRCQVIAMACAKPKEFGVLHRPLWSIDSLTAAYLASFPDLDPMSRTSVQRILHDADLRPHRMRLWLHSPDPLFREKVTEICELYLHPPPGSLVLCMDEKTGMQALGRKHPVKYAVPGQEGRFDYEYVRNGTRKLLATFEVHTGKVYGEVRETRTGADLVEFMEAVARRYEHPEIHVVWDNLNIHHDGPGKRWTEFNERHKGRFHFHYTPIHASWVNQVELFFGILHRRVLKYAVHDSLDELDAAVLGFIEHWTAHEAHPIRWTLTGYPLQMGREAA